MRMLASGQASNGCSSWEPVVDWEPFWPEIRGMPDPEDGFALVCGQRAQKQGQRLATRVPEWADRFAMILKSNCLGRLFRAR